MKERLRNNKWIWCSNLSEVSCIKQPCEQFLEIPKPKKRITNLSVGNLTSILLKLVNTKKNKQQRNSLNQFLMNLLIFHYDITVSKCNYLSNFLQLCAYPLMDISSALRYNKSRLTAHSALYLYYKFTL